MSVFVSGLWERRKLVMIGSSIGSFGGCIILVLGSHMLEVRVESPYVYVLCLLPQLVYSIAGSSLKL